jgi:hypothetical protein
MVSERHEMACKIMACCQFFKDNMKGLPKTADYIKNKLCLGDYEVCSRFRIYKEFGGENIPPGLDPDDTEEVKKIIKCLHEKREFKG